MPQQERRGPKVYSRGEEIANSVTHGLGAALSLAGLAVLVALAAQQGDPYRIIGFAVFGGSLTLLYSASTLYHSLRSPRAKGIMRMIDHASIYLLIAGTYTPFLLVSLRSNWGWALLAVIWGLAVLGIALETLAIQRLRKVSALPYVLMGWLCVVALREMLVHISPAGLAWLVAGGVAYTAGVAFYVWRRLPYNHAVWHLFVLAGSICHFMAILVSQAPALDSPPL